MPSDATPQAKPAAVLWASVLERLKPQMNRQSFETWVAVARGKEFRDGALVVQVPNEEFAAWLSVHAQQFISEALADVAARDAAADSPQKIKFIWPQAAPEIEEPAPAEEKKAEPEGYSTLPEEAWYGYAARYREAVKETTEANDVFHFASFMAVAGALVGRNVYYKSPDPVFPNLFVLLVGRSGGARKGSAMGLAHKLLHEVMPRTPRPLYSIDSAQGVISKMLEHTSGQQEGMPPATIVHLAEFDDLVHKAARKGTSDIFAFLNRAYDAPEWLDDNRSQNPLAVQNGLLVLLAGTQEDVIDKLGESTVLRGIGNRFTYWPGLKKRRNSKTPDPHSELWRGIVSHLKEVREHWQKKGPTRLDWTPEAFDLWDRYYCSLDDMLEEPLLIQILREREHTNLVKFAMIYCALDRAERMGVEHLRPALQAAAFQHRAILALFGTFGASGWVKDELQMIELVRAAGPKGIRQRDLQRKFPRMSGEHFQRHLRWLTVRDGPLSRLDVGYNAAMITFNG